MRTSMLYVCFGAVLTCALPIAYASAANVEKFVVDLQRDAGTVEFRAVGRPSMLRIVGKGAGPEGSFTVDKGSVTGSAVFDLDSLDTGIEMRNHHMKEKYLETGKFPKAKLSIVKMTVPKETIASPKLSVEGVPFEGVLSLHGTDHPVSGKAKLTRDAQRLALTAEFGLKISDFGIAKPGFAGVTMAEDVDVVVQGNGSVKE